MVLQKDFLYVDGSSNENRNRLESLPSERLKHQLNIGNVGLNTRKYNSPSSTGQTQRHGQNIANSLINGQ